MAHEELIQSEAQNFFTRLREAREREGRPPLQGLSISGTYIDENGDSSITHEILQNRFQNSIDSHQHELNHILEDNVGTSGPVLDQEELRRMWQRLMDSMQVPRQLLEESINPPLFAPLSMPINAASDFTITTVNPNTWSLSIPIETPVVNRTTQEKHVDPLTEEKKKELEELIVAANVPAEVLDKFREAIHRFYTGYSTGAQISSNNGIYKLMDKLMSAAQSWYLTLSSMAPDRLVRELFRHPHANLLLETMNAVKAGGNPFVGVTAPVISTDIVKRFISELSDLLKAKKATFDTSDQNLGDRQQSRLAISFETEDVILKDGPIGPVNFNKFDIVVNAYDFGYACADNEVGPDQIFRIRAQDPVYPNDDDDTHSHPHLEYEHLCFGDGLGIAGNLVRAALVADAFQYIERILMTYGSSPYIDLGAWTDACYCSVCDAAMSEDHTYTDHHTGRMLCRECSCECEVSGEVMDIRYVKHCHECGNDFDARVFLGTERPHTLCINCFEEQEKNARREAQFNPEGSNTAPQAPAFPVVAMGTRNCPSCAAQLGVSTEINGITIVENQITGFDPLTGTQTCLHCDPDSLGISARSCEPNMREAYIWAVLYQFLPHAYTSELMIRNEDSFDTELLKSEWRAINWYKVLATFRDRIGEHGYFAAGLPIDVIANKLNEMFGYNVISEVHLSRV